VQVWPPAARYRERLERTARQDGRAGLVQYRWLLEELKTAVRGLRTPTLISYKRLRKHGPN
jgi:hypothetical protein